MIALASIAIAACAGPGSALIRNGRAMYNDAIIATNNQQLLANIVRTRYCEPSGQMVVTSVTANMRLQASVGGQVGVGPDSNFAGNLVPLSVGGLYEDNPTISYSPVQGQEYLRQALSPLPLDMTILLLDALGDSPRPLSLLLKEINGAQNPAFIHPDAAVIDPRFSEIVECMARLHRHGHLVWAQEGTPPSPVIVVYGDKPDTAEANKRLRDLLLLPELPEDDTSWSAPVALGVAQAYYSVGIRSRSLYDLLQIASASIDVPQEHLDSGIAPPVAPVNPTTSMLRIHSGKSRPDAALVAVQHNEWWYWIDDTDGPSKQTFRVLDAIMAACLADAAGAPARPVLTLPVSR